MKDIWKFIGEGLALIGGFGLLFLTIAFAVLCFKALMFALKWNP